MKLTTTKSTTTSIWWVATIVRTLGCWAVLSLLGPTVIPSAANGDVSDFELPGIRKKLAAKQPVKIVCLGDSVTGIYYHTGGRRAYPEMLAVALKQLNPQTEITVINAGISGNSTVDALKRLQKDVLNHKPDLVTVMFGLNDMTRVPKLDFQTNLKQIIERCRGGGAEVILCTPNGVIDTSGRPIAKLLEYCDAMKAIGGKHTVPVCDCYAAYEIVRRDDPIAWRLLLSDEIHPNMDGHKINAVEICRTITGKSASLQGAGPPQPALSKTQARLKAGEPIRVLAMTPIDQLIAPAFKSIAPNSKVEVTPWPTADQTLLQLEQAAAKIRTTQPPYDLVVIAVPLALTPSRQAPSEAGIRSYSWILNWSLSFGLQQWDVIGVTPSVLKAPITIDEKTPDAFARQMIFAQDLNLIAREENDTATPQQLVERWLKKALMNP